MGSHNVCTRWMYLPVVNIGLLQRYESKRGKYSRNCCPHKYLCVSQWCETWGPPVHVCGPQHFSNTIYMLIHQQEERYRYTVMLIRNVYRWRRAYWMANILCWVHYSGGVKTRQTMTSNMTLRRVRITIFVVVQQEVVRILSVCLKPRISSMQCACAVLYYHLWSDGRSMFVVNVSIHP
jgi:hypothetical protein